MLVVLAQQERSIGRPQPEGSDLLLQVIDDGAGGR